MRSRLSFPAVIVEIAVIVGSILLAFGIDAWWDNRKDRMEEQTVLAGLEAEFVANVDRVATVIARHESFAQLTDELDAMPDSDVLEMPVEATDQYMRAMGQYMTFEPRGGTLAGVVSGGQLALIQDHALRELLMEWLRRLDDAEEEAGFLTRTSERITLRESRIIDLRAPVTTEALLKIRRDDEYMALVRAKLFFASLYVGELRALMRQGENIIVAIQSNRGN